MKDITRLTKAVDPVYQSSSSTVQKKKSNLPGNAKDSLIQRSLADQAKSLGRGSGAVESKSKLSPAVQAKMENSFQTDFSDVTIHQGDSATQMNALAYTQGNDIHFAPGKYNPESKSGQQLLGHELTHVVQQRNNSVQPTTQLKGVGVNEDKSLEKEADEMGKLASEGKKVYVSGNGDGIQRQEDPMKIQAGSVALYGEGEMSTIKYIHHPGDDVSGVTIGKGYDMGTKEKAAILADLKKAGVSAEQAAKIAEAEFLTGDDAKEFVAENKRDIGPISDEAVINLFQSQWIEYRAKAKDIATSKKATKDGSGNYTNARGREIEDGEDEGTYVMTEQEWNSMHPALIDFLTDLKYHGGYYLYGRVAKINEAIKKHPNDQIGQLKAVRELFTEGYMTAYTAKLGFKKYTANVTETFFGQNVQMKDKYRRDAIRVAYLDTVISALESGKAVEITGLSAPGAASNVTSNVLPKKEPVDIISATVGVGSKNLASDVKVVQTLLYKAGYNITITGTIDKATIDSIYAFQKTIFNTPGAADGVITPFKTTITKLKEYQNKSRIQPVVTNKASLEQKETPVQIVQQAYNNYKNGTINMVSLGSKLKQNNMYCPQTVVNIFNALDSSARDNLAYTMANQSSDAELSTFHIWVLERMSSELGGWFNTTSWSDNATQKERVDKVVNAKKPVVEQRSTQPVANATSSTTTTASNSPKIYSSQRDNKFSGTDIYGSGTKGGSVNGDNMCNVTSLAMSLKSFASDHDLKVNTTNLLINGGYTESKRTELMALDLEDLIIKRFVQLGSDYFKTNVMGKDFKFDTYPPHQFGACLAHVGKQICSSVKKTVDFYNIKEKDKYISSIKPELEKGNSAFGGTSITASGHVVHLVSVLSDGLLINDPYGLVLDKPSAYLKNGGANNSQKIKDNMSLIETRLKHNSALLAVAKNFSQKADGTFPGDMGENVFFSWDDLSTFNIFKWLIVLKK